MINAGIGETQLNNLLAAMNLPPISTFCLKEHKREISKIVEEVAEISCNTAISQENVLL